MKNIYLYGASDDCCELDSDCGFRAESYSNLKINNITVEYKFDGDWKIKLVGNIPKSWIVKKIESNSDFIHIQIPDKETIKVFEPKTDDEPRQTWKQIIPE